jgi:hypothetical protein
MLSENTPANMLPLTKKQGHPNIFLSCESNLVTCSASSLIISTEGFGQVFFTKGMISE